MKYLKEFRKLVKIKVMWNGGTGWTLYQDNNKFKTIIGTKEDFAKYLRKIKAKDDITDPKSVRNITYMNIVNEIIDGTDNIIWVWSNHLKEK